jgi:crotonobetainyl-CoA:carnitine CoA-transferase CaiB-like acyl-CoA transferase
MDRLGLGAAELQALNPDLTYISASGMGRTGPEAKAVAYGTLLQCYAGFAGLNRHPERPPRVGFAWLDPMCGLLLPFLAAASLWRRAHQGGGTRVDLSMVEALLWTLAEPVLEAQTEGSAKPKGNRDPAMSPHGVYPCQGEDAWLALAVRGDTEWQALCRLVPGLANLTAQSLAERQAAAERIDAAIMAWSGTQTAEHALASLRMAGIAAASVASSADLVACNHLNTRGFWEASSAGVLPALPWQASFGRAHGPAPGIGEHTDQILAEILAISADDCARLRVAGATA